MARKRRSTTKNDSNGESGNATTTERQVTRMADGALTAEDIQALLGRTRQKGQYIGLINQFIEGGKMGVDVKQEWPELAERQATTLKQGFDNTKDKKGVADGAEHVRVIKNGESVALINMAVAGEQLGVPAEA